MTTLNFQATISAPKEKVWDILWSDEGYRKWTAVFSEGSYAESDWEEGSKIKFLTPSGEGMYGIIKKKIPLQEMIFEHHGELKNGVEESKDWKGATEGYRLVDKDGGTELQVELDITPDFQDYFEKTFPKAMEAIRTLSEQH